MSTTDRQKKKKFQPNLRGGSFVLHDGENSETTDQETFYDPKNNNF